MKATHVASLILTATIAALFLLRTEPASSVDPVARDPGVRGGEAGAGRAFLDLTTNQAAFFTAGANDFGDLETVADGLGPRMNLDSCGGCHIQPALGGTSPNSQFGTPPFGNVPNPQVAFASKDGGTDLVPSFFTEDGPVREARFVLNPDGTRDGGVHALFTLTGRAGAGNCVLAQPDFATQLMYYNVIFRIPTPTFGAGLIEQIPDAAIMANQPSEASLKQLLGILGRPNFQLAGHTITGITNNNGNDGTIARFGWKAQNKSLLLFSGEAYNVEVGVTNEIFAQEREEDAKCATNGLPESPGDNAGTYCGSPSRPRRPLPAAATGPGRGRAGSRTRRAGPRRHRAERQACELVG